MQELTLVADFNCFDCGNMFLDYPFTYVSDADVDYIAVSCPSCGGNEKELPINQEEPK